MMGGWSGGMSMGRDRFHGNTYNTMVGDEGDVFLQKKDRPIVGLANAWKQDAARGGAMEDRIALGKGKGLAKKHNFQKDPDTGLYVGDDNKIMPKTSYPRPKITEGATVPMVPSHTTGDTSNAKTGVSSVKDAPEIAMRDTKISTLADDGGMPIKNKNPFREK